MIALREPFVQLSSDAGQPLIDVPDAGRRARDQVDEIAILEGGVQIGHEDFRRWQQSHEFTMRPAGRGRKLMRASGSLRE